MRTKISVKVVGMMILLFVVYMIGSVINTINTTKISTNVDEFEGVYTQIRIEQKNVLGSIETVKLYCNMIATGSSEESAKRMSGSMAEEIDLLNENLSKLQSLCEKVKESEDVLSKFLVYKEKLENIEKIGEKVANSYKAGNKDAAVEAQGGMYGSTMAMDEANTAFEEALTKAQNENADATRSAITTMTVNLTVMAAVFLILIVVGAVFINSTMVKPIKKSNGILNDIVEKINADQGDLTVRIPVKGKDEISQLATGINHFLDTLQKVMLAISSGSYRLNQSVEEVNVNALQCRDETGAVSSTMEELSASMQEISATLHNIERGSNEVFASAKDIAREVSESVQMVEDINSRADAISENSIQNKEATEKIVMDISENMRESIEESKSVERITELTDDILSISSQTNLLALNASIEAARAGEAGKGFAVVADEIRQLADSSRSTANSIQEISSDVMEAVKNMVKNADAILKYVTENVMTEYSNFVDVADDYKKDAGKMKAVLDSFEAKSQELERIVNLMSGGIGEINRTVEESVNAVVQTTDSASSLLEQIENITEEIGENSAIANELMQEVNHFQKISDEKEA